MNIRNYKDNASLLADARRSLLGHLSVAVSGFLLYSEIGLFLNGLPQSLSFQNPVLNLVIMLAGLQGAYLVLEAVGRQGLLFFASRVQRLSTA